LPHTSVPGSVQTQDNPMWRATKDKGMILYPKGNFFAVYMDTDFAGNWNHSYTT